MQINGSSIEYTAENFDSLNLYHTNFILFDDTQNDFRVSLEAQLSQIKKSTNLFFFIFGGEIETIDIILLKLRQKSNCIFIEVFKFFVYLNTNSIYSNIPQGSGKFADMFSDVKRYFTENNQQCSSKKFDQKLEEKIKENISFYWPNANLIQSFEKFNEIIFSYPQNLHIFSLDSCGGDYGFEKKFLNYLIQNFELSMRFFIR